LSCTVKVRARFLILLNSMTLVLLILARAEFPTLCVSLLQNMPRIYTHILQHIPTVQSAW